MSRQTHFFATKADLLPRLALIESQRSLKYVRLATYYSSRIPTYETLLNYQKLGTNTTGDHHSDDLFFVMDKATEVRFEKTRLFLGISAHVINQVTTPETITFQPGGLFKNRYLICGHIGTASDSDISIDLYKHFSTALTNGFEKVGSYYVGENAMELLHTGMRLITMGIDEPTAYDLHL